MYSLKSFSLSGIPSNAFKELLIVLTICFIWAKFVISIQPPGEVSPDIEIEIGSDANITCRITDGNISRIWFSEEETARSFVQPNKDIIILDGHTAILAIRNASEHMGRYQCMLGENAIGITKVYAGKPPTEVTDFSCKGFDFDYMICSFTKPSNMIYTKYELNLKANLDSYSDNCILQNKNDAICICNITISSKPILISREIYNFNLTGSNSLGVLSQFFTINNYQSVVPSRLDVVIENTTSDTVLLTWRVRKYPFYSAYGLEYRIDLEPLNFPRYRVENIENCISGNCSILIDNLKYAFFEYAVFVRAKVKTALDNEIMWSDPFVGTFNTQPRRPDRPPKTALGSFHIDPLETQIRMYWQELENYEKNGPNFFYAIRELDPIRGTETNSTVTNGTSIIFPWHRSRSRIYELRSGNVLGISSDISRMLVYPLRQEQFTPQTIATVYHNRSYTLSWKPPLNQTDLVNYTVFWCLSKMETPNQCRGGIHFEYLDRHTLNFTTEPQDHTLNFAISANFLNGSTGMQWARCSADISSDLMKLEPEVTTVSATEIRIYWSTESVCPSILQGYNLSYCQVLNGNTSETPLECVNKTSIELPRNQINVMEYTIKDLEPYSRYRIEMFMYSKSRRGPNSDPIYGYTMEAAPSPPSDLRLNITSVTSNSAKISWMRPVKTNGVIKYYTIWITTNDSANQEDNLKVYMNETKTEKEEYLQPVVFKLESLKSFFNYEVYVTAHTVDESEPSNTVRFKTLIGRPTNPRKVTITDDGNYGILKWVDPEMPSGRVEYYEVAMVLSRKSKGTSSHDEHEKTFFIKEKFCKFKFPACMDYYLKVRAVNVAERNEVDHYTFPSEKDNNIKGRLRRHTNPEINTRVVGRIQRYDTDLSNVSLLDRFNEKSNMVKIIPETTIPKIERETLAEYDFYCEGAGRVSERFSRPSNEYILLPSAWERTPFMYMRCSEYPLSNFVKIAPFTILLAGLLATTSYWLRKRYKEMKNIDAVLPQELVGHSPKYNIDYHNDRKESNSDYPRNSECLSRDIENLYLLRTVSQDIANGGDSSLPQATLENHKDAKVEEHIFQSLKKGMSGDSCETVNNMHVAHKLTSIEGNYIIPSDGYTKPKYMNSNQTIESNFCEAAYNPQVNDGYIQQNLVNSPRQSAESNGYTTVDTILAPTATEITKKCREKIAANLRADTKDYGVDDMHYTSALSIICSSNNDNNNNNNSRNSDNNGNSRSVNTAVFGGYVTQKQLAEYGQLLY